MQKTFRNRVKPEKKAQAKMLRKNMTASERLLWEELRCKRLGAKFRRQAVMLGYIVDFWCPSSGLVVELDGAFHKGREEYDARRDNAIKKLGFNVLRIQSSRVFTDLQSVLKEIRENL